MNCTCGTCANCKAKLSQPSPQFNNGGGVGMTQPTMTFEQFNSGQHTPIYTGQQPIQQPIPQPMPAQVAPAVQAPPVSNITPTEVEDPEWCFLNCTPFELIFVGLEDPMKESVVENVAPKLITNPTPTETPATTAEVTPSVENNEVTP